MEGAKAAAGPVLYVLWATAAIGLAIAKSGLNAEAVTRLLVVGFLLLQLAFRARILRLLPALTPAVRFVLLGTLLAAAVEGFHMISVPVFASLRVDRATPLLEAVRRYGVDLLYTVPAYLVIFTVVWRLVSRFAYGTWTYAVLFGIAQTLGDGGVFFFGQDPWLLVFLPYPATNYHAMNVLPFLAVRGALRPAPASRLRAALALPAVVATYLVCGAVIKALGRRFGLEG